MAAKKRASNSKNKPRKKRRTSAQVRAAKIREIKRKVREKVRRETEGKSREEILEMLDAAMRRNEIEDMVRDWPSVYGPEQLHLGRKGHQVYPRGSIALVPSRARALPAMLLDDIMRRMRAAYKLGDDALDELVHKLAYSSEFSIREIYTLWFSP